jgi:hypothetical protein
MLLLFREFLFVAEAVQAISVHRASSPFVLGLLIRALELASQCHMTNTNSVMNFNYLAVLNVTNFNYLAVLNVTNFNSLVSLIGISHYLV